MNEAPLLAVVVPPGKCVVAIAPQRLANLTQRFGLRRAVRRLERHNGVGSRSTAATMFLSRGGRVGVAEGHAADFET